MGALVTAEANSLVNASLGTATYTAPTTPIKLRLMTANGSASAAGTEVTGGSYASQTITFASASGGSAAGPPSGNLDFTGMPAVTVVGVEIWDSNGTPRRLWWGALTTSRTLTAGDVLRFPASSITAALT